LLLKGRFVDLQELGITDLDTKSKITEVINSLAHMDPVGRLRLGLDKPAPGAATAVTSTSAQECARALETVMWDDVEPYLIPIEVLALWTNNFSQEREIGSGAFGSVFEAIVPKVPGGGRSLGPVAVKKLSDEITLQHGQKQFRSEIKVLR
jgi:hypothetical protein